MNPKLEAFCSDAVEALTSGLPLQTSLENIAANLSVLLIDPTFVGYAWAEANPPPKRLLHHDPQTDFYLLAHAQRAGKAGLPHSHGASWAIYGIARGYTDMIEWRHTSPASAEAVTLEPACSYRLGPGETRAYGPHLIHSTAHPEGAWVIRMTGTDLDRLPRFQFNPQRDRRLHHV
jgi:predicted metal-dependent enzyme (double-stranded beta helix superfamily)